MNLFTAESGLTRTAVSFVGAALAMALPVAPANAGGDITNFNVKNCTQQRMFVCSFDKTDSLMKIPYKARGIQPGDKKEFGCASLNKCKVIIGVSKKKTTKTLSTGMQAALGAGSVAAAGVSGGAAVTAGAAAAETITVFTLSGTGVATTVVGASTVTALTGIAAATAVAAVAAGGAVAAIEIADGWKDGEVCNKVRKAAQKAGLKPKSFMKDGKKYQVIEQYATDKSGDFYVNPDGTAVLTYMIDKGKGSCPAPLDTQLVPN
ncbi:hypothetical protein B5C34_12145 [Pacificimonas flava]|uniref:Uncharacterized protein n=2 Tax=Pacificimonas TaxID=1960290 RepID=A0A219B6Z6_9SPHN|nr:MULTISPECIES: hypothetical protein [Pacificimonas]MBZ6378584.1 hypothetical protein [Pacificimonas aurantium]OWV34137.1 hypothetical protein B5C34_12145 [Pacificimonas flava]